jgi:hypothetical protein
MNGVKDASKIYRNPPSGWGDLFVVPKVFPLEGEKNTHSDRMGRMTKSFCFRCSDFSTVHGRSSVTIVVLFL